MVNACAKDHFRGADAALETLADARINKTRRKFLSARNPYSIGTFAKT